MRGKDARASGKLHLICKLGNFLVTHTDWGDGKREVREAPQLHAQGCSPCLGTEGTAQCQPPATTFLGSTNPAS